MTGGFASGARAKKRALSEGVSAKSTEDANGEGAVLGTQESFLTSGSAGKVDVVWYVDQSGSMNGETANVQRNFATFMNEVSTLADTRVALVAASSGSNSISIVPVENKAVQVNQRVSSRDALTIAINTFVRVGGTLPFGVNPYNGSLSSLASFFRADVPAVVVVVTDDDANGVTSANFEELAKSTLGKIPKLFAFRATNDSAFKSEPGCQVARQGVSYEVLANNTGGEVFDICEPDWSNNFEKLKQGIAKAAQNSFPLKKIPSKLTEVKVNGAVLAPSAYSISGNLVSVKPEALPVSGEVKIDVTYQ
jgi:hypothetical protein